MDCACGHPIVWKKDMSIVAWNRETFYLHTECVKKYFVVDTSGHCIPTLEFLDIIEKKRVVEEKVEAPEVEPAKRDEPVDGPLIPAEIKCPKCGGQAAYSVSGDYYVCLDCQSTIPREPPK